MKTTKPESKEQKTTNIQLMKVSKGGVTYEVEAPYCTPEEWAARTKMTEEEVMNGLYDWKIARHQFSPKGRLFVNVIAETQRLLDSKPWK
jgi:hypothetical protein|tara:strand:- start:988 stop:1257 length:270 start_codon:yes stop_codon:yes gene_type:complete